MDPSSFSPYPLEHVSEAQIWALFKVLWGWQLCSKCEVGTACDNTQTCTQQRCKRLGRFIQYYKEVTQSYIPELLDGSSNALRTHQDVYDVIHIIKDNPGLPRLQLTNQYFSTRDDGATPMPPLADQNRGINLAVRVMAMVNCSIASEDFGLVEMASDPIPWRQNLSFIQFMNEAFSKTEDPSLNEKNSFKISSEIKKAICAKRLKRVGNLQFRATDDLRNHLKLDAKQGVVDIYHHTSVMKEHLYATRNVPARTTVDGYIKMGNIPRQIALEVLDSIHLIIFPPDTESQAILRSLVRKGSFDPDCLRYESASYRSLEESEIGYPYFGSRLLDLYEEVQHPQPRGLVERWLERRSGGRHVMMATLVGVIIAVVLGFLGLVVGCFQAWVAYMQWKHPISP